MKENRKDKVEVLKEVVNRNKIKDKGTDIDEMVSFLKEEESSNINETSVKKQNIKPKGVIDLIKEDPFLSRKMTYEEFEQSTVTGISDDGIEEAYKVYKEFVEKNDIKPKGVMDFIKEDPFLSRKITYEEFEQSTVTGIKDDGVEEAYDAYKRVINVLNENKK